MAGVKRKALIQHSPGVKILTSLGAVHQKLRKTYHYHICAERGCTLIYSDFQCPDVAINGRCHVHRGTRRPEWEAARDPQPCCVGNTMLITDNDELVRYKLAGPGPWFSCTKCSRSHGWAVREGVTNG